MTYEELATLASKQSDNALRMAEMAGLYIEKLRVALDALATISVNKGTIDPVIIADEAIDAIGNITSPLQPAPKADVP